LEFNINEQVPAAFLDTHTLKAGFQGAKAGFQRMLAGILNYKGLKNGWKECELKLLCLEYKYWF